MRWLAMLVLSGGLAGCAPMFVLMRGPDGELARCESNGLQGYAAHKSLSDCVQAYEAEGYHRVRKGAPSKKKPPQNATIDQEFEK